MKSPLLLSVDRFATGGRTSKNFRLSQPHLFIQTPVLNRLRDIVAPNGRCVSQIALHFRWGQGYGRTGSLK